MKAYNILTVIISLTALFAYLNKRIFKLPSTIGIMILSLLLSLGLIFFRQLAPYSIGAVKEAISYLHFKDLFLNIMLSFLLFAGAMNIDIKRLREHKWTIVSQASIGVLISTGIIAVFIYFLFRAVHSEIDFIYCLLFGALISPTDPIAVLGILRKTKVPLSLETKITGESLLNDGFAIVIFLTLLETAKNGTGSFSISHVFFLFLEEAGGGLLFGLALGLIGFYLLKSIDDYEVEVLITLAMVMGGYSLAESLHLSGPIAIVAAGIITGTKARELAMSEITRDYLSKFWEVINEILNAILFLLIGFEILVIQIENQSVIIGLCMIFIVLFARFISVLVPIGILWNFTSFEKYSIPLLTWGGLRGGLPVAMVLSLPKNMYKDEFLLITYIVVVFSIIVQGLTIGKLARWLESSQETAE